MTSAAEPHPTVTYDLASLEYKELLRAHLRFRYRKARRPIALWVGSMIYVLFTCAGMGFLIGMALWPRFKPEPLAAVFALLGLALPYRILMHVSRAGKDIRNEGLCKTELTPDGIVRKTSIVEIKYRWVPGQSLGLVGDDLLILAHKNQLLWLPRRAFSSQEDIDAFLESGRKFHRMAMEDAMNAPPRPPVGP